MIVPTETLLVGFSRKEPTIQPKMNIQIRKYLNCSPSIVQPSFTVALFIEVLFSGLLTFGFTVVLCMKVLLVVLMASEVINLCLFFGVFCDV